MSFIVIYLLIIAKLIGLESLFARANLQTLGNNIILLPELIIAPATAPEIPYLCTSQTPSVRVETAPIASIAKIALVFSRTRNPVNHPEVTADITGKRQ